jgi:hypothetical protein
MDENLVDKQKHAKEFRLRILLTNQCDKKCFTCLNDFQEKGEDFISPEFVEGHIKEYISLCKNKCIRPVISLSGGEPGLHPEFSSILYMAVRSGAKVQVNTNGLIDELVWDKYSPVDIRYHMGHGLRNKVVYGQTAVFILSELYSVTDVRLFMTPFHEGGMKIKTFAEYHSSEHFRTVVYPQMLSVLGDYFPVSGRHTGVQENRGAGCECCSNECITLKALWLFPNNTSSFCPQRDGTAHNDHKSVWDAYHKHKVFGKTFPSTLKKTLQDSVLNLIEEG